jgi:hypothetical protein
LASWVVTTNYYSISAETFKYHQSVINQLNAKESMFDPIPSQLKSNFRCISDSTQLVLGYFEVSSKILTKQDAFYYNDVGSDVYRHKRLNPMIKFPKDSIVILSNERPGYWVDFPLK